MPKIEKRETFKVATIEQAFTFLAHGEEFGFTHATVTLTKYAPKKVKPPKVLDIATPGKIRLHDAREGKVRRVVEK